ncbi:MAG: metalloenzyme [Armatimonadota bacterium]|nr:metalloenzyme [Armatimonadota bacterium]MDR7427457.1 metalloenzyme [Armatimonadota bacterium]MDR7465333.1 metalloenzyme [Armatimonadota bacterium]MDR7469983.1 metalloenzyme [Armatimonadota bacterium]MDR7474489.1 metalloenzyme [Armatimonadota bacterium]
MAVLLLFLDGVGLGELDPAWNPWVAGRTPTLQRLLGGPLAGPERVERDDVLLVPTDATLGMAGLPQSGTGQTALLTGLNAAALVGRHVTAYPTAPLRALLLEHSLFVRLAAAGRRVALANAYTEDYHQAVSARRLRHGAITIAAIGAGVRLRTVADLRRAQAVFHDLTNARLRAWGYDLPLRTPFQAGRHLAHLAAEYDFTLFEFFLTDLAAHGRVEVSPVAVVELVDEMLAGITAALPAEVTLVVSSDHGNIEDGRTRVHTANPVPTLVLGPARRHFREVAALTDIAPAVLRSMGVEV